MRVSWTLGKWPERLGFHFSISNSKEQTIMRRIYQLGAVPLVFATMLLISSSASADLVFNFVESGGQVTFNYSGSLDTNGMTSGNVTFHAGTFIFGQNVLGHDLIGVNGSNTNDLGFTWNGTAADFYNGTDFNFGYYAYAGSTPFMNRGDYSGNQNGISLSSADVSSGIWTGSGAGFSFYATFAAAGLIPGTHISTDNASGESIIFNVGSSVPEPSSCVLVGSLMLGSLFCRRRRR